MAKFILNRSPGIVVGIGQLCLCLVLLCTAQPLVAAQPSAEYKLKAALIYKLTKFVEWPQASLGQDAFGICLLGDDEFGEALDALEKHKAKGLPIKVHRHTQSEAIDERCQIVFISASKQAFIKAILQSLGNRPILTISDMPHFAEQGGILQFSRSEKRIGFIINLQSGKGSRLAIAAPFLDLATVVESAPQETKE